MQKPWPKTCAQRWSAHCVDIVSSRRIGRACYEDLAFLVQPDHSRNCFAACGYGQILGFCQRASMVSLGHVVLDGTKVQAKASQHKATSPCSRRLQKWRPK